MTVLDATRGAPATSEIRNNLALSMAGTSIREDAETILTNIDNGLADSLAQHTILFHSDNLFTFTGTALTYATTGLEIKVIHNSTGAIFTYTIPTGETLNFTNDGDILYAIIARDGSGTGDTPSTNLTVANNNLVVGATTIAAQAATNIWFIPIAIRIDSASDQLLHWFFGHGTWASTTSANVGISGGAGSGGGLDKWVTSTVYNEDDVIWNDITEKIYACTGTGDGHTSGTFATDYAAGYWNELSPTDTSIHEADTTTHGTTGDIVGTSDSQVLTNKDIDGGTASDTLRITIPKNTKSNLDGLTRKEGTISYATDMDQVYIDDGTVLKKIGPDEESLFNELSSLNYQAGILELLNEIPDSNSKISIAAGNTDVTLYSPANKYFRLNYDASKTISTSTTTVTVSSAPTFTVKTGDVIVYNSIVKKITNVSTQTSYTIESAFSADLINAACNISQAVHTVDLNAYTAGGQYVSAGSQFTDDIYTALISTEDSEIENDTVADWGSIARIAFSASANGTDWSNAESRTQYVSDTHTETSLPVADTNLYIRFFANKTSGSGQVNLLKFKVFWIDDYGEIDGADYFTAFARISSGKFVNCTHSVVNGKSRLTFTDAYAMGLNSTDPAGSSLAVYFDNKLIPRYIDGTKVDTNGVYFKEISAYVIEFDQDYSSNDFDILVKAPITVVDTNTQNTTRITTIENKIIQPYNLLDNADMRICQRGNITLDGSPVVIGGGQISIDRFVHSSNTVTQELEWKTGTLANYSNYNALRITATSSDNGSLMIGQNVGHKLDLLKGKTITLSGWVTSNHPYAYLAITDGVSSSRSSYHSGSGLPEYLTVTHTVSMSATSINIRNYVYDLDTPSTVSISSGDYTQVELIKLELGEVATPFVAKSEEEELRNCLKYYEINRIGVVGSGINGQQISQQLFYKATKYAVPTLTFNHLTGSNVNNTPVVVLGVSDKNGVIVAETATATATCYWIVDVTAECNP